MVSIRTRLMLCLFVSFLVSNVPAAITKIVSDDFNGTIGTKNSGRALNNGLGGSASLTWQSENPTVSALIAHPYDGTVALNTGGGSDYFAPPVANSNTYTVEVLLAIDSTTDAWHHLAVEKNPALIGLWGAGGFGCSFSAGWLQAIKWGAASDTSLYCPSGWHSFAGLGYNSSDKDANGNIPIRIEYTVSDRSTTSSITATIYSNNNWKAQYVVSDFKTTGHSVALIGGNGRGIWDNLVFSQITVDPTATVTATPTPAPTPTPVAWFSEGLRRFNAPIGYDANYHNAVMAEIPNYVDLDANFWVITADVIGYAYYNSAVATKAPGLGSIDSLRQILTEVRKTKPATRFVAYMNVRSPVESLTHSNWRAYDWNGNTIMYNGAYQVCLNTPYTEEFLKPMMAELLAAPYNMDGFWFDGICLNTNECRCSYCQALFKSQTGYDFPTAGNMNLSNPVYKRYLRWRLEAQDAVMRGLMSYVQSIKPSAIIQSNSSHWRSMESIGGGGNVTIQSEAFTRSVTETCAELFWHIDRQGDPIYSSFILKYSRGIQGDRAVEMWSPPTLHGLDDGAVPQVELLSRVFTTIGNGGIPQLPVGWGHYSDLKAAFAEIKSREPWLINTSSMKFAAVVASANTRDFYAGAGVFENYMKEIFGIYRAITEEHLPCDIIGDINLENDDLTKYKVIVLPDTGSISQVAQDRLRAYVNAGGGLIATGQPTRTDVDGNMQSNFGLADVLNAKYVSTHTEALESVRYFMIIPSAYHPEDTVLQHCGAWVPLCMGGGIGQGSASFYGNPVVVNPQGTATVALNWQDPQNGYSPIPAVIQSTFGTGKVTYFPSNWGKSYFKYGYPYLRRILIQEMLRVAATAPQVVVDAPMAVQANYFTQPYGTGKTRILVHLLNDASSLARASMGMNIMPIREEVLTLSDIKVRLNDSATAMRAVAVPEGSILGKTSGPGYQEFTLPKLGLYQIISIEPESGSGAASGVFYNE